MAIIKIDINIYVTLSLLDSQAVFFHKKLEGKDPRVVLASSINPKIVGGIFMSGIKEHKTYTITY
ncbi:unnamed protein product [Eruca vesicaria subsp. sativa]|uniref:Uncharacterized protein n=1 Tax=Eruca vesicaria subsp. sativa TaxID=29727 RepID=A0ABC8JZJ3_ERUVS|nr:unnamed protein product [Eruca vesicaria subsp. sativa]